MGSIVGARQYFFHSQLRLSEALIFQTAHQIYSTIGPILFNHFRIVRSLENGHHIWQELLVLPETDCCCCKVSLQHSGLYWSDCCFHLLQKEVSIILGNHDQICFGQQVIGIICSHRCQACATCTSRSSAVNFIVSGTKPEMSSNGWRMDSGQCRISATAPLLATANRCSLVQHATTQQRFRRLEALDCEHVLLHVGSISYAYAYCIRSHWTMHTLAVLTADSMTD